MIRQEEVYKIGRLGKAHGVKGEVSFQFDDDVFDRTDADYLILDIDGILVPFFMEEYRFRSDALALVKFCDVDTQERASELTGSNVYFPRALAEDEEGMPSLASLSWHHCHYRRQYRQSALRTRGRTAYSCLRRPHNGYQYQGKND